MRKLSKLKTKLKYELQHSNDLFNICNLYREYLQSKLVQDGGNLCIKKRINKFIDLLVSESKNTGIDPDIKKKYVNLIKKYAKNGFFKQKLKDLDAKDKENKKKKYAEDEDYNYTDNIIFNIYKNIIYNSLPETVIPNTTQFITDNFILNNFIIIDIKEKTPISIKTDRTFSQKATLVAHDPKTQKELTDELKKLLSIAPDNASDNLEGDIFSKLKELGTSLSNATDDNIALTEEKDILETRLKNTKVKAGTQNTELQIQHDRIHELAGSFKRLHDNILQIYQSMPTPPNLKIIIEILFTNFLYKTYALAHYLPTTNRQKERNDFYNNFTNPNFTDGLYTAWKEDKQNKLSEIKMYFPDNIFEDLWKIHSLYFSIDTIELIFYEFIDFPAIYCANNFTIYKPPNYSP